MKKILIFCILVFSSSLYSNNLQNATIQIIDNQLKYTKTLKLTREKNNIYCETIPPSKIFKKHLVFINELVSLDPPFTHYSFLLQCPKIIVWNNVQVCYDLNDQLKDLFDKIILWCTMF